MVASQVADLKGAVTLPCYTSGDRASIASNALDKVQPIVRFLGSNKYIAGGELTYVDFVLFELCELMQWISEGQLFTKNPTLLAHSNRMKALPRLSDFYQDDTRCMKAPFNNKVAKLNN